MLQVGSNLGPAATPTYRQQQQQQRDTLSLYLSPPELSLSLSGAGVSLVPLATMTSLRQAANQRRRSGVGANVARDTQSGEPNI